MISKKEDDNNKVNIDNDKNNNKKENFNNTIKENNIIFHKENDSNISLKFDDKINNNYESEKEIFEQKINNYNDDYIYDDAPNEFFDGFLGELMEDPVILPTSNITMDRKTIENILLNYHMDPFNRKPLTKEELIPNIVLKKRIEEYKLKKMKDL